MSGVSGNTPADYEARIAVLRGALQFLASETTEHSPTATRNYANAALADDSHADDVVRKRRARELRERVDAAAVDVGNTQPEPVGWRCVKHGGLWRHKYFNCRGGPADPPCEYEPVFVRVVSSTPNKETQ